MGFSFPKQGKLIFENMYMHFQNLIMFSFCFLNSLQPPPGPKAKALFDFNAQSDK